MVRKKGRWKSKGRFPGHENGVREIKWAEYWV